MEIRREPKKRFNVLKSGYSPDLRAASLRSTARRALFPPMPQQRWLRPQEARQSRRIILSIRQFKNSCQEEGGSCLPGSRHCCWLPDSSCGEDRGILEAIVHLIRSRGPFLHRAKAIHLKSPLPPQLQANTKRELRLPQA